MTLQILSRCALLAVAFTLAACDRKTETAAPVPAVDAGSAAAPEGIAQDAGSQFNPLLRSEALKDAIHSAMTTGQNQRWQDGDLSGYAVPSQEKLANGCRTIRYTVDQQPDAPMMTINACAGSR
jgi:hypothetical protein